MLPRYPRVKSLHPIYKVTDSELRIGAEPFITSRVDNADGMMEQFLALLDGTRTLPEILSEVQKTNRDATLQDVEDGVAHLLSLNFIEDAAHQPQHLTEKELARWSRNIKYFEHFADEHTSKFAFQERLKDARVCVLGLGGHGSGIVMQLAALGVGHLVAVDFDELELSNLNRLTWYAEKDVGRKKTELAKAHLAQFAPDVRFEAHDAQVLDDVQRYARGSQLIICAIDHPYAQIDRWVNEAALSLGIPCIFTSHFTATGRYYSIIPGETGCIDCMIGQFMREDPLFREQFWALARDGRVRQAHQAVIVPNVSVLTGMIVAEALRYLCRHQAPLSAGKMMIVNFNAMTSSAFFDWPKYDDCPTCGHGKPEDWPFFGELEAFSRPSAVTSVG